MTAGARQAARLAGSLTTESMLCSPARLGSALEGLIPSGASAHAAHASFLPLLIQRS